jgi:hypothetical protein
MCNQVPATNSNKDSMRRIDEAMEKDSDRPERPYDIT